MDKFMEKLQAIKTGLPANCTQANLVKLIISYEAYEHTLENLPPALEPSKKQIEINCRLLGQAINHITHAGHSARESKYYFRHALAQFNTEIDQLVATAGNTIYKSI